MVICCVVLVTPLALVLHPLLRRFGLVVGISTAAFTLFLLAIWLYFELFKPDQASHSSADLRALAKLLLLAIVASLIISSAAGLPTLLAMNSQAQRKRPSQDNPTDQP